LEIVKRAQWLPSFVQRCRTAVPPAVEHHVGKTLAIKKAFYFAYFEKIEGDYVEFGTYQGNSMISAFHSNRGVASRGGVPARKFWGFDSFEGFNLAEDKDRHPYFTGKAISSPTTNAFDGVSRNSTRGGRNSNWSRDISKRRWPEKPRWTFASISLPSP
jgi:macrocin-O-methyltransferase TylF-like protien